MDLSCDPEKAYTEDCCELSGVVSLVPLQHTTYVSMSIYIRANFSNPCLPCGSVAVWRVC